MFLHGVVRALVCLVLVVGALSSCEDSGTTILTRFYTGTAGVGDFINLQVDPLSSSISYANLSNGDCDTVDYELDADGFYDITDGDSPDYPLTGDPDCVDDDPVGNVIEAFEIPGFAMLLHLAKAGESSDTESLLFAVQRQTVQLITGAGDTYNYMQFRTSGGIEVGAVSFDPDGGDFANEFYWPYALVSGQGGSEFQSTTAAGADIELDPTGTYYIIDDGGMETSYAFGTTSGMLLTDNPNGAIIAFRQPESKDFDPAFAGTYAGLLYHKTGVMPAGGGDTGGTLSIYRSTLTVAVNSANGDGDGDADNLDLTIVNDDASTTTLALTTLDAVADQSHLVGMDKLGDSLHGVFTARIVDSTVTEDIFVTFVGRAMLVLYFRDSDNTTDNNGYDYYYGMALRQ